MFGLVSWVDILLNSLFRWNSERFTGLKQRREVDVNRSKVPIPSYREFSENESGLVAEPAEPEHPAPALVPV
jgi:hypothetical protein